MSTMTDPGGDRESKRQMFTQAGPTRKPWLLVGLPVGVALLGIVYFAGGPKTDGPTAIPVSATVKLSSPTGSSQPAPTAAAGAPTINPSSAPASGGTVAAAEIPVIKLALSDLNNGQAKFFEHSASDGSRIRFFAIRTPDGSYRTALDACEICYQAKKGYMQNGNVMVCRKCGRPFPSEVIGQATGGCHPIAIPNTVDGEQLIVKIADLESIEKEAAAKSSGARRS